MFQTNQIIRGDATQTMAAFPSESVNLIIADLPYLVNYRDRSGRAIANDGSPENVLPAFAEMYRVLKDDSYCFAFVGWTEIAQFSKAWTDAGFRTVGQISWEKKYASKVWHTDCRYESAYVLTKGRPGKPGAPVSSIQSWEYTGNKRHPTEKAVSILTPLVKGYSKPGDIVLDPFAGSGSTLVAAALEGRRYLGIEIEERYCISARTRLQGVERYLQRKAA